ncbi:argininosuccinate lyase [bacterium]|nr:argininosuccinate lyase [bacterium]
MSATKGKTGSKAWAGRFDSPTDARVEQFTESISFDRRLYRHDIAGSIAHATMLAEVGLMTKKEAAEIARTLRAIEEEITAGEFSFDISKEDIHLHIESELVARLGDVGRKLHTGRSRNDQVSLDLRLWTRDAIDQLDRGLIGLQKSFVSAAIKSGDLIIPAYTHLQRAQPVLAAHYLLAYVEKFARDRDRLRDARRRVNVLPLGAAALAGTSLPINRKRVAELLGFDSVAANSLDVSSDRDFVIESVFGVTLIAEHLSAWAEEWILWTTTEFDTIRLPDAFCTGSSIMPQKKNPDVLELIRGKTARVIGSLQTLLVLIKGLPLAYNRDLQEDKPPLFDAFETVAHSVELASAIVENMNWNRAAIESKLELGFLDATTLMEQLIHLGMPMRSAHEAVGKLVRTAIECNATLANLPVERFEELAPGHGREIRGRLGARQAVLAFQSEGSTAPKRVQEQLQHWKRELKIS